FDAGELAVTTSVVVRDRADRVDRAQDVALESTSAPPLCFREDALYAALPPREFSPDVALDVVAVEDHARAGREPPYERQVARGAERPEPHRVEPPRAQLGGEGSTHPGGFPFPGDVRNAVRDPEPRDAGDVAG